MLSTLSLLIPVIVTIVIVVITVAIVVGIAMGLLLGVETLKKLHCIYIHKAQMPMSYLLDRDEDSGEFVRCLYCGYEWKQKIKNTSISRYMQ